MIFLKIYFNETPKGKTNKSMIIGMVRALWIYIFTHLVNTIRRRHFDHNCLIIIAYPALNYELERGRFAGITNWSHQIVTMGVYLYMLC